MKNAVFAVTGVLVGLVIGAGAMRIAEPARPAVNVSQAETACQRYQSLSQQMSGSVFDAAMIYFVLKGETSSGFDNPRFAAVRRAFDACASTVP